MANDVLIRSAAPQIYVRYIVRRNSYSTAGNGSSNISVECWSLVRNGTHTGNSWDYKTYNNGESSGSTPVGNMSGDQHWQTRTMDVGHDANGNLTYWVGAWLNTVYGSGTAGDNYTPGKITRSAGWSSSSASLIKPTTARITNTVSDWGIGTSHGHKMYYRLQGSGSGWTATSDEASTNPRSWDLTGLKPGKT
jgi:hypothetical protein